MSHSGARLGPLAFGLVVGLSAWLAAARAEHGLPRHPEVPKGETRFFFSGDGQLRLRHGHFAETLHVRFRSTDGTYDPTALQQVAHFFRSRGDGTVGWVSLRLIELLSYLQKQHHLREMILLSGYRSPEFNEALGRQGREVAFASLHTQGLAADLALPGSNLRDLWLQLRGEQIGGVGYYRSQRFLHVDVGPSRFWEETTSRVSERLSAGNARLFLRTDFDRYPSLRGAEVSIHSVTAFPLRLHRRARLVGEAGLLAEVEMVPSLPAVAREVDGCWVIEGPAARYPFQVTQELVRAGEHATRRRGRVLWQTCDPRVESTPVEIESNLVEGGER